MNAHQRRVARRAKQRAEARDAGPYCLVYVYEQPPRRPRAWRVRRDQRRVKRLLRAWGGAR